MNNKDKRLYLIDGHALIYRAYYALIRNPLTNTKGVPTGAVYGFANYLLRLLETHDCQYWAIALDSDKPTFRHKMYAEYKANREEMPDDLKTQIPLVNDLIAAMNIPWVRQDGVEADDLIAALTRRAVAQGFEVYIISKDKDLMQLVGPRVRMLAPEAGGALVAMGPDEVKTKMGVEPERIIDYLALVGDASDNIPGLPGVGPKTALKLLAAAGSVENLLKDPGMAKNAKLEEKIKANKEILVLSRKLATLQYDVALDAAPDALRRKPMKHEQCIALFKELEFGSLLRNPLFSTVKKLGHATRIAGSIDELAALAERIADAGQVSIDTETTSTEPRSARLVGIALAIDETEAFYVPVGHVQGNNLPLKQVVKTLRPVIESPKVKKIGQNLKYDCQVFKNEGIDMKGLAFDAMVAAYLIDPGKRQYNLDKLAADWLGVETTPIEALIGKGKTQKSFGETTVSDAASYAGEDVIVPIALKRILEPLLVERKLDRLYDEIEMPLVQALADLEWAGVLIDTTLLKTLSVKYSRVIDALTSEIHDCAGVPFNLNSPKQVSEVLFDTLKLPRSKKTKVGSYETNVDVLEKLAPAHPIARKILDHREAQKLLSTYIDTLPAAINPLTGRVHTSFNQTVTATGRLSSTGPNLQNIPVRTEEGRQIREAFVAPRGHLLVSADYSQIELRILAHLSQDPFLLEAFHQDKDIHTQTASAIYGCFPEMVTPDMRRAAKTINFGLMYGMGPVNLSRQLGISFAEANRFIDAYFRQFPKVKAYIDASIVKARDAGYTETMLGRRRYLPDIASPNRTIREAAERVAINTPVQGTAADIIKIAMVRIHEELPAAFPDVTILLQVHDELVFEAPQKKAMTFSEWVKEKMGTALKLDVPLKVDAGIGKNWKEAH
ncbi:MAG: DNA polymerase I [Chitinispirillaceae bacterium]|nr:DNA polymerase I [Chitinispirillaceae bacterium]